MSLIKCGTDENGSYIELKRPRGETPQFFEIYEETVGEAE